MLIVCTGGRWLASRAVAHTKPAGVEARVQALVESGMPATFVSARPAGLRATFVDFLDACAAVQTAQARHKVQQVISKLAEELSKRWSRDYCPVSFAMSINRAVWR